MTEGGKNKKSHNARRISLAVKIHKKPEIKKVNYANSQLSQKEKRRREGKQRILDKLDKKDSQTTKTGDRRTITEDKTELKELIKKAQATEIINERLAAKVEQQKKIIMWSGVAFFMLLIASVWIYDVKKILKPAPNGSGSEISNLDFEQISDELSAKMKELKESLGEIKNFTESASDFSGFSTSTRAIDKATGTASALPANSLPNKAADIGTASTVENNVVLNQAEELNELRKKLEELEKKLEKK